MEYNHSKGWDSIPEEKLNPWFSMWLRPRDTMRSILDKYDRGPIILLAALGGIANALNKATDKNTFDTLFGALSISILGGIITGIIGVYIMAALLSWTGKWIGGQGTYDDILSALCWSNVPFAWSLIVWALGIVVFGRNMFVYGTLIVNLGIFLRVMAWIITIALTVIDIWAAFTSLKCLAEAQQFSAWKALGNYILAVLVIFVPIMVLGILISIG